jgi:hypothetical protein
MLMEEGQQADKQTPDGLTGWHARMLEADVTLQ